MQLRLDIPLPKIAHSVVKKLEAQRKYYKNNMHLLKTLHTLYWHVQYEVLQNIHHHGIAVYLSVFNTLEEFVSCETTAMVSGFLGEDDLLGLILKPK